MAKSKTKKTKKASKPVKKQDVSKKKSDKKPTEKKPVKKIILTTDKKAKKAVKEKPVKAKKSTGRPATKKTKKTPPVKETKSVLTTETKSEAVHPEQILNPEKTEQPVVTTPVTEEKKEVVVEETKKEEPVVVAETKKEETTTTPPKNIGILPVDDDDDEKLKQNVMATINTNVQKVYTFKKGIEFVDGHLKIGIDGTNISRRNDIIFDIYGKSENGAEFKTEFECIDKEEGDFLAEQLTACEKNPADFMKGTPTETAATTQPQNTNATPDLTKSHALDAHGNIDMTKLTAEEIMSIQNGNLPKKQEQNFAGIPLTSVNIDDMINNLPPKTENQNITTNITPATNTNPVDISNILNNQSAAQIEAYGKSIEDHINSSFQANVWGGMPQNDVRLFLKNCDGQYLYDLVSDEKGFFLKIKKDATEIRVPKNPNEYLKVK